MIGLCEALLHVAAPAAAEAATCGSAQIAFLRQARRCAAAARSRGLLRRSREDDRGIVAHRCFEARHVRKALVFDADEFRRGLRRAHARRRDSSDRLAVVAHERVTLVRFRARIAQLRDRQHAIENVHGLDAGIRLGRRRVDRLDAGVRHVLLTMRAYSMPGSWTS